MGLGFGYSAEKYSPNSSQERLAGFRQPQLSPRAQKVSDASLTESSPGSASGHIFSLGELSSSVLSPAAPEVKLIGREKEQQRFKLGLVALRQNVDTLLLLEGAAGLGKTALLKQFAKAAVDANTGHLLLLHGYCDAMHMHSAHSKFHAFKNILRQLLHLDAMSQLNAEEVLQTLREMKFSRDELQRVPVLNDVLPLGIPETQASKCFSEKQRNTQIAQIITHMLVTSASCGSKIVLLLDNMQWADKWSFHVTLEVLRNVTPLLAVIATRTISGPGFASLRALPNCELVRLCPLTPFESARMVCTKLEVSCAFKLSYDCICGFWHCLPAFSSDLLSRSPPHSLSSGVQSPCYPSVSGSCSRWKPAFCPLTHQWVVGWWLHKCNGSISNSLVDVVVQ